MSTELRHQCLIYQGSPSKQLPALANMIQLKLYTGYRCMYLNGPAMVAGMRAFLSARGVDVVHQIAKAALILSSEPIGTAEGGFDIDLMLSMLEDALDQALTDRYKGLWATGDMTWEFGAEKNVAKLMEYERRLEELFRRREELCGVCQYHRDTLPRHALQQGVLTHRGLFINETLSRINQHYAPPGRAVDPAGANPDVEEVVNSLCRDGQLCGSK